MTFVVYSGGHLPVRDQQVVFVCDSEAEAWEHVDSQGGAPMWQVYSYEAVQSGAGETAFGNNETRVSR